MIVKLEQSTEDGLEVERNLKFANITDIEIDLGNGRWAQIRKNYNGEIEILGN